MKIYMYIKIYMYKIPSPSKKKKNTNSTLQYFTSVSYTTLEIEIAVLQPILITSVRSL